MPSRLHWCHVTGAHPFDVDATRRALIERGGGYEVVHSSPGLEIGVYVLVAPEPDRQQPHDEDEVYVVLEGSGVLEVEDATTPLDGGHGALRSGRRRAPLHGVRAPGPARRLQRPALRLKECFIRPEIADMRRTVT